MKWILSQDEYPKEDELVLTYSKKSGYGLGSWITAKSWPGGKRWTINDKSGGLGTASAVNCPYKWMRLPKVDE